MLFTKNKNLFYLTFVFIALLPACDKINSLLDKQQSGSDTNSSTSAPPTEDKKTPSPFPAPPEKPSPFPAPPAPAKEKNITPPAPQKMGSSNKRIPSITEIPVEAPLTLPVDRLITDSSGRKLDVTITARYGTEIAVTRKKDSKSFDLPIEKLSEADITFVLKLPTSSKPEKVDPFVTRRIKMIQNYEKDIIRLREEVVSGNFSTSQMRGKNKEQGKIDLKIQDLQDQIRRHLAQ